MAYFGRQFSDASPVLTMSPQPSHQNPFAMGGFAQQHAPPHSFGAMNFGSQPQSGLQQFAPSASRKRSRDEASANLEPEAPPPVKESEDGWTYGPGMVLIKPDRTYIADASTQSGTWLEEKKAAEDANRQKQHAEPLTLRCRKSQRMDRSVPPTLLANNMSVPSLDTANPPADTTKGPVIDDFTLHLGIGWTRISEDEDIQAAARGWARFIENHYPLRNVNIRLESKGLQSYLVETSDGFFLFAETLRRGQLVSSTIVGALQNLQSMPPKFDGVQVLHATESPLVAPQAMGEMAFADTDMNMD